MFEPTNYSFKSVTIVTAAVGFHRSHTTAVSLAIAITVFNNQRRRLLVIPSVKRWLQHIRNRLNF
jgi:hypothetical protein